MNGVTKFVAFAIIMKTLQHIAIRPCGYGWIEISVTCQNYTHTATKSAVIPDKVADGIAESIDNWIYIYQEFERIAKIIAEIVPVGNIYAIELSAYDDNYIVANVKSVLTIEYNGLILSSNCYTPKVTLMTGIADWNIGYIVSGIKRICNFFFLI